MFFPLSFVVLAFFASLLDQFRGQGLPDGCKLQDGCYEGATREAFEVVNKHDQLVPLCEALKNETGFQDCGATYGNGSCDTNPWTEPVNALVESLCSEENLRVFSTPQLPQGQCFHLNFAIECVAKSLVQYESIGNFLRSDRNETVCRTYENVIGCKKNILSSDCYTKAARNALERNINAFDMARNWLCDDGRAKLREFAGKFHNDGCSPNDDAITECSNAFVHNVSQSGSALSPGAANKLFQDQIDCIRSEFQSCQVSLTVVDGYLQAARTAFVTVKASGATRASASLPCLLPVALVFAGVIVERVVSISL